MLSALDDYNWSEVFGEGCGVNTSPIKPDAPPGATISVATFSREDVKKIYGQEEGEHDGADWIVWGQLHDGRFFVARGGCDYTGWDCRASNSGNVAKTKGQLIRFGMSEDERERFGVPLEDDNRIDTAR
jgi:hypothetical protein